MIEANFFPSKLEVVFSTSPLSPYTGTPIARELVDHPLYEGPTTVTPTEETQTLHTEDFLLDEDVTVDAIPSNYVGSAVTSRSSSDLSTSGATVTAPAGYYGESASASVLTGTEGTPVATKSSVSDNTITVTPSVTNTEGYINGGSHDGTPATVSASELVIGTKTITTAGTTNVTNYKDAFVAEGSASPPATISGTFATYSTAGDWVLRFTKDITVTPEVVAGYVSSGTTGTVAVTLSAMDTNFVASNIKKNVEIFGKVGTCEVAGSYPWYGSGTILYAKKLNKTINLKNDTTFDSWTASTTAGTIKAASTTNDWTCTVDKENTWWFVTRAYVDVAFKSGATLTKTVRRLVVYYTHILAAYPSTNANLEINNRDSISTFSQTARGGTRYYTNTPSTLGYITSYNYGPMYMSNTPTLSISGTTVSCKLPALYARCNSSYFATARKTEVDSANTNMTITVDVYKTPRLNTYLSKHIGQVTADLTYQL